VAVVAVSAQQSTGGPGPSPPPAVTLCDRLTTANGADNRVWQNEYNLVQELVVRAIAGNTTVGILKDPITADYFNGKINYRASTYVPSPFKSPKSPNFNTDATAAATLINHLVNFFGASGALGCTAVGFPQYQSFTPAGSFTQYQVHANMNITASVFSAFNSHIIAAATSLGANSDDQNAVNGILGSFARTNLPNGQANEICTQPDCPCATGITGSNCDNASPASSVSVSAVSMLFAMLLAVVAMRR
jgi:hypothetical protein